MGLKQLALENRHGDVVRTFRWNGEDAKVIRLLDTRRVEVWSPLYESKQEAPFEVLGVITEESLKSGFSLENLGSIKELTSVEKVSCDVKEPERESRLWWRIFSLCIVFMLGGLIAVLQAPREIEELEEELKTHIVRIIEKAKQQPKPVAVASQMSRPSMDEQKSKVVPRKKNVQRLGALAVLGSMKKSRQRGGLNLGAAKATEGPGLGGTGGSGGLQKNLYAKGIIAAPVGPGANIKGGGGYGTKGKGGGKAGYGSLSLVGSVGTSTLPLGTEALIEGGLDRDAIDAVVQKNIGQIRFCYEQGLQLDPKLKGRVVASWVIQGTGSVTGTKVKSSSLNSQTVENCILLRLRSWKFPLPRGGVNVKVNYPFMLNRVSSG